MLKGIREHPVFEENPFEVKGLKWVSFQKQSNEEKIINVEGKIYVMKEAAKEIRHLKDSAKYIKVYHECIYALKELSSSGIKIVCFIMTNLGTKKDVVEITPNVCMEFCGYKNPQNVYEGIKELLEKEFICKTQKTGYYFVNPNYFYNGKRT